MIKMQQVFDVIRREREYQDNVWPKSPTSVSAFLLYIEEYLKKAKDDFVNGKSNGRGLYDVRKIAALAVACMEHNGAIERYEEESKKNSD